MSRPVNVRPARSNAAHLAASVIRWTSDVVRIAEKTAGPLLDLFLRLWLAEIFWISGMVKLQNWTIALYLSAHEYPVAWLDPVTAAWVGEAIELICPPLLVFGLATRLAALPMLILSLAIQFSFQALDQHIFWAVLFAWFVIKGAGPISLDALIGRGIAATALPLTGTTMRLFDFAVAVGRSGCQAPVALLDRGAVFSLRRHEGRQFRHDADSVPCRIGSVAAAAGLGRPL